MGIVIGICLGNKLSQKLKRCICVLILGVNGFIGNYLIECLLCDNCYEVYGLDIGFDVICCFFDNLNFYFVEGDISIYFEWIEYYIKKCDVILFLVVIVILIEYI